MEPEKELELAKSARICLQEAESGKILAQHLYVRLKVQGALELGA
jgi:hypothetical protein